MRGEPQCRSALAKYHLKEEIRVGVKFRQAPRDRVVREATFHTRATAENPVRFALVGDLANGKAIDVIRITKPQK